MANEKKEKANAAPAEEPTVVSEQPAEVAPPQTSPSPKAKKKVFRVNVPDTARQTMIFMAATGENVTTKRRADGFFYLDVRPPEKPMITIGATVDEVEVEE